MNAMAMTASIAAAAPVRRIAPRRWALRLAWTAVIALSALIIVNTLPYYSMSGRFSFLVEKGALALRKLWRTSFYLHIGGGILCLAAGPFLFWNALLRHRPALHRAIGRAYGLAVLGWGGPTGLYMSLHAKGGLSGKSSFFLLSLLWWGTTAAGVWMILRRRPAEHRRWMIRSYSLTLSAVFFRIFHAGGYFAGLPDATNYGISLWLSLASSLALGELWVRITMSSLQGKGAQS